MHLNVGHFEREHGISPGNRIYMFTFIFPLLFKRYNIWPGHVGLSYFAVSEYEKSYI